MQIKVFGPGCARCNETENVVASAVKETGSEAIVEKVTDLKEIMILGLMSLPAITIDGKLVCSGRIPTKNEVKMWITSPNIQIANNQTSSCCHCG